MLKIIAIVLSAVVLLFLIGFFGGRYYTSDYINEKLKKLDEYTTDEEQTFTKDTTITLPLPVENYFSKAVGNNVKIPKQVIVTMDGFLKTNDESDWLPITAVQHYSVEEPGFLWNADLTAGSFFKVKALDSYIEGRGSMLVKFFSSITITDAKGPEMDISSLFRYYSEAVFFPSVFYPNGENRWEALEENKARFFFADDTLKAKMDVTFGTDGLVQKIETTDKLRFTNTGFSNELNITWFSDYRDFEGRKIPYEGKVAWFYKGKIFEYSKFKIKEIKYLY